MNICLSLLTLLSVLLLGVLPASAQTTGSTGGGQPFDNRQPTLAIQYIIALQGIFPFSDGSGIGEADRSTPYLAEIRPVAFNSPIPVGWTNCGGQTLSISQNQALSFLLGTNYGGNGTTTFQLPNLLGRVPIGAGQGPGLPNYSLGQTAGVEQLTLATTNLPSHVHSTPGGNTGATGNGDAFNNLQPTLALNFLITENGEIMMFAGNFAISGWALCDGSTLNIADNTNLFNTIGTTYGGDGVTTFKLPDLRGRTPVSSGQRPGASAYALGQINGTDSVTLTSDLMPAHTHTLAGGNTGSTGGSAAFDNRQPTLAMKLLVESAGSFPPSFSPFGGEVRLIAGNAATGLGADWVATDGTLYPVSSYPNLYSLLGMAYGGNGNTTFAVPDLRGVVAVGLGQGTGTSSYVLGQFAGQESVTLTTNQMPAHTHSASGVSSVPPPLLNNVTISSGQFRFAFTNTAGQSFTVLATTNVALSVSNWTVLGSPIEGPSGQFQFTDPQTTNNAKHFYRVRWP